MAIALVVTAVAFAAFCVWLTVRIVNQRERWAKWTLAAVVGLPVLYVLSFGPACWIVSRQGTAEGRIPRVYWPIGWIGAQWPEATARPIVWYATLGMPAGGWVMVPFHATEAEFIGYWMPVVRE